MSSMSMKSPVSPANTGVWVGIAAITMSFAAYSSALIVRQGANPDWQHFTLPGILFFNTLVVLASSATLYVGRPRGPATIDRSGTVTAVDAPHLNWLYVTILLGLAFLIGQILAWRNLVDQGITLASGPSSSFFYLLTAMHGLHLLGGLAGLRYVVYRVRGSTTERAVRAFRAASLYWHFMTVLWLYLFALLATRI
ncbi:MAG: cytochrome c oxidase subunit [Gemmatimonadaceae bacterium]|nr:cytochrome c oxidase subunit [Gemmatimonadaceae bacterium]